MWKIKLYYCFITLVVWAASILADDPIEVKVVQGSTEGPFGCSVIPKSMKVKFRFQSLNTSSGLVFHRKTVAEDLIGCFEADGFEVLSATDISDCAEATVAAGLEMYRWENGNCTGYARGIPKDKICQTNEAVVLYSVDAVLEGPENVALKLNRTMASIWAEWGGGEKCHPDYPSSAAYFTITWNGTSIQLNSTTFEYRLMHVDLCTTNLSQVYPGLLEVTLEAFDNSGNSVMAADTQVVSGVTVPGSCYLLKSGNILYYEAERRDPRPIYDVLEEYCRSELFGTMFVEYKDGDFATYRDDLADLASRLSSQISYHFMGLRKEDNQWTWTSGLPQEIDDADVWESEPGNDPCSQNVDGGTYRLVSSSCMDSIMNYACHEML